MATLAGAAIALAAMPGASARGAAAGEMVAVGTRQSTPALDSDVQQAVDARWGRRLRALEPSAPAAYFNLAEEVDDARTVGPAAAGDRVAEAERRLVRELFALAGQLDPDLTAASARAIADITPDARERRRLLVVADLLEGDRILRGRALQIEGVPTGRGSAAAPEVLRIASAAIAAYRRGAGEAALEMLAEVDPGQLADVFAPWPGGIGGFRQDCRRRPGGMRVRRLLAELSAEVRMLEGDGADWAAIIRSGGGTPLEEVDTADLARLFAIDASRSRWRDGGWVAR